jgi:Flp pilus assembly protein TadG
MKHHTQYRQQNHRSQRGAFSVLTAMLAFLVIVPIGLLSFELQRAELAQKQLRVTSDAAALASALACRDLTGSYADKQQYAINAAVQMLQRNNAIGKPFGSVTTTNSTAGAHPKIGDAVVAVNYDQDNQLVTIDVAYGYNPAFGSYLGINNVPLTVNSKAGTGASTKSDIVIAFDISCSMFAEPGNQPMTSARVAMMNFIDELKANPDNHVGLIVYGTKVSGSTDPSNANNNQYPVPTGMIGLDQNHDNFDTVKVAISQLTTCNGSTNTTGAIQQATTMITGPGHRKDAQAYVLLVTDGMPNFWYPLPNAQDYNIGKSTSLQAGTDLQNKFKAATAPSANSTPTPTQPVILHSLGFFHGVSAPGTPNPMIFGPQFLDELQKSSGGYGKVYIANNIAEFIDALKKLAHNDLGLVN